MLQLIRMYGLVLDHCDCPSIYPCAPHTTRPLHQQNIEGWESNSIV